MMTEEFDRGLCDGCEAERPMLRISADDGTPVVKLCKGCLTEMRALFVPEQPTLKIAPPDVGGAA